MTIATQPVDGSADVTSKSPPPVGRSDMFYYKVADIEVDAGRQHRVTPTHVDQMEASIRQNGQLSPVVCVRIKDARPRLVIGYTRHAAITRIAAENPELDRVAVTFRKTAPNEADSQILSLIENMVRNELNPLDTANAVSKLVEVNGLTQAAIAERLGMSQPWVSKQLKIFGLDEALKARIADGAMSVDTALAIVRHAPDKQAEILAASDVIVADEALATSYDTDDTDDYALEVAGAATAVVADGKPAPKKPAKATVQKGKKKSLKSMAAAKPKKVTKKTIAQAAGEGGTKATNMAQTSSRVRKALEPYARNESGEPSGAYIPVYAVVDFLMGKMAEADMKATIKRPKIVSQ